MFFQGVTATVPEDGLPGFAPGCLLKTGLQEDLIAYMDGTLDKPLDETITLMVNQGTSQSCEFRHLRPVTESEISECGK